MYFVLFGFYLTCDEPEPLSRLQIIMMYSKQSKIIEIKFKRGLKKKDEFFMLNLFAKHEVHVCQTSCDKQLRQLFEFECENVQ